MNVSTIFLSLVLVSALAVGMTSIFVDVSQTYRPNEPITEFNAFGNNYDVHEVIGDKMLLIQSAISETSLLNPLTWGNVVTIVINAFSIMFYLPEALMSMVASMSGTMFIIPQWVLWLINISILIIIIFAMLGAINKWKS